MTLTPLLPRTGIAAIWRHGQHYEYTRYEMRKYSYLLGRRKKNIKAFRKSKRLFRKASLWTVNTNRFFRRVCAGARRESGH